MTHFVLNHQPRAIDSDDPRESLLRWLKRQHLTGTKEGCADGDCGACTVALVERDQQGQAHFKAVNSCLLPMGLLPGRTVLTVEALAQGEKLHPAQQAMVDCAGSQCGYCTPGFVMSLFVGMNENEHGDHAIEGNLCRCTGYRPIRAAQALLQTAANDSVPEVPPLLAAQLGGFFSPTTVEHALALKAEHPDAQWIHGATDLGVQLSRGQIVAPVLIALDRIAELEVLNVEVPGVLIGAGVTLTRLERELKGVFPALDEMLQWFAARQVRNRATLGGNLGSASPIGDLLPVLLALDAQIQLRGAAGTRWLPAEGFFVNYRQTQRTDDELIVAVEIPRPAGLICHSLKLAKRQTDDISIVAACFAIGLDDTHRVRHVRLAYGGVAAIPLRAIAVEGYLHGRKLDAATISAASAQLQAFFTPLSDQRASGSYRRALCGTLFEKFCAKWLS